MIGHYFILGFFLFSIRKKGSLSFVIDIFKATDLQNKNEWIAEILKVSDEIAFALFITKGQSII